MLSRYCTGCDGNTVVQVRPPSLLLLMRSEPAYTTFESVGSTASAMTRPLPSCLKSGGSRGGGSSPRLERCQLRPPSTVLTTPVLVPTYSDPGCRGSAAS